MGGATRKKNRTNHRQVSRMAKTKRRTKDVDEILEMLNPENVEKIRNRDPDPLLPGDGMHFCIICDRYFISAEALETHKVTGKHKFQVKRVKEGGISPKETELLPAADSPTTDGRSLETKMESLLGLLIELRFQFCLILLVVSPVLFHCGRVRNLPAGTGIFHEIIRML